MPTPDNYAWKAENLSPEERMDRFFNLIDHAVSGGVPLESLYRREHLKELLSFILQKNDAPCKTCTLRTTKGSPSA